MSGVLVIPTQFATAVTATGAQLDGDFNTVTAYINDPTNRNNFVADGGAATNTIVLTFSPPVVGGYTAGLEITFKATNTSTGAVVVNANGLGNKSLVNPDGSALASGEIRGGSVYKAVYDGTQFVCVGVPLPHPGIAKAWVRFDGTVTGTQTVTTNGFNVSNIVRAGTGSYAITFTTPFNSAPVPVAMAAFRVCAQDPGAASNTATVNMITYVANTNVVADATLVYFICFGTQ